MNEPFPNIAPDTDVTLESISSNGAVVFHVPLAHLRVAADLVTMGNEVSQFTIDVLGQAVIVQRHGLFRRSVSVIKRTDYAAMKKSAYKGFKATLRPEGKVRFECHVTEGRRILDREFKARAKSRADANESNFLFPQSIPVEVKNGVLIPSAGIKPKLPSNAEIRIEEVTAEGDVMFAIRGDKLGLTEPKLLRAKALRGPFANALGELLVRKHIDLFKQLLVEVPAYDRLALAHEHRNFGLSLSHGDLIFQFNFDLLRQIIDEEMNRLIMAADNVHKVRVTMQKPASNVLTWIGAAMTAALGQLGISVHVTIRQSDGEFELVVET
jgi:hypothetical protein